MASIQKNCGNCKRTFQIEEKDSDFYARLGVSEPTLCPLCRVQRRMTWRNDRSFYLRKCDLSGKQMVSIYPADTSFPVYHPDEWYSDKWNALAYGQDFNFEKPFFEQWNELFLKVPRLGIDLVNCENSYYCNYCGDDKNCYLDIAGEGNEDCYFDLFTKYSKNCVDCTFVYNSELCYESINCYQCYGVRHSIYLDNCSDCSFCFDLKGCKNCLFSSNLRQKEFYIFNKPYTKEAYEEEVKKLKLGSHEGLEKAIEQWKKVMQEAIHRDMVRLNSENCLGDQIKNSKNCYYVFNVSDCEDSKYLYDVLQAKDCQDLNYSLYDPERSYELISTLSMKFSAFSLESHYCNEVFYCKQCNNSSSCFGCIGLSRAKYCILNKQYTKEDYESLLPRIIEQMEKTGEWGEFFPSELAPFGYNETVAQEYYPLGKEQALKQGFNWKDSDESSEYQGPSIQIPDLIENVDEGITKQILRCEVSGQLYKVVPQELRFYKEQRIPIPRRSPDQRHRDRLKLRNPRALWNRPCAQCNRLVWSSYSAERPEKVFCEECYLKMVY